jgi:hypothetical protein
VTTPPLGRLEVPGTGKTARTEADSSSAVTRKTPVMSRGSWPAPPIKTRRPVADTIQSVLAEIWPTKSVSSDCPSGQSKRDSEKSEVKVESRKIGADGTSSKKTINLLKEMGTKKNKPISVSDRGQPQLADILKSIKKR